MKKYWEKEEEIILEKAYKTMHVADIHVQLLSKYTVYAIKSKVKRMGICKEKYKATQEDIDYIKTNFPTTSTDAIAKKIGCSYSKVCSLAYSLNLKKTEEYVRLCGREAAQHEAAVAKRFKKGNVPANKGKTWEDMNYTETAKTNMLKTAYKKGHTPHNTERVGDIIKTKDGYLKIKIGNPNKWMSLHRLVWIKHKGSIPSGCNIQFKDCNRENCSIGNLYLVSRSDQVVMNRQGLPLELVKTVKHISKINKILKSYGKQ